MSDVASRNYIFHLTRILEDETQNITKSVKKYIKFLRNAAVDTENRKFPSVIVKLFKEIKKGENPRGLNTGELVHALNLSWKPTGRLIVKKTADPTVFIIRFSNAADFAAAIYSIPNRAQGFLLTMRMWNNETKVENVDFSAQDFWVNFILMGDLVEKQYVAKQVADKIGKVLNLIGPLNDRGEYQAYVVADISFGMSLVHEVKVIIIDPNDTETVKVKIFFMEVPHQTCFRCWHVDASHSLEKCNARRSIYNKNCPKVYVYNEEEEIRNEDAQTSAEVEDVTIEAAGIRIYDSGIDMEDQQRRGIKRRRSKYDSVSSFNNMEMPGVGIIGDGRKNVKDREGASTYCNSDAGGKSSINIEEGLKDEMRGIRIVDKGKSPGFESSGSKPKESFHKRRQENWFRLIDHYSAPKIENPWVLINKNNIIGGVGKDGVTKEKVCDNYDE
ncbi:hypothetical protein MKW92_005974, partial [Papaver armeniacum]